MNRYDEYTSINRMIGRREYGVTAKIASFVRNLTDKENKDKIKEDAKIAREKKAEKRRQEKAASADVDTRINNLEIPTSFSL